MYVELRPVFDPGDWVDVLADRQVELKFLAREGRRAPARDHADAVVARLLPRSRVLVVAVDETPAGHVWLGQDDAAVDVFDVCLDDPGLGRAVREAVLDLVWSEGRAEVRAGVAAGEPAQDAFVEGGGFTLTGTNMRLDLTGDAVPDDGRVRLDPMTADGFTAFMADQETTYAAEREQSGESPERSARIAREQLAELLPEGPASADQHFLTVRADTETVGHLWLATEHPTNFLYDVVVVPDHRGRGHGRAARGLYDALGYAVTEDHYVLALDR